MIKCFSDQSALPSIPIVPIIELKLNDWLQNQDSRVRNWINATNFKAKSCEVCLLPNAGGELEKVLVGMGPEEDTWVFGHLSATLPKGHYHIESQLTKDQLKHAVLAWGLGSYQYTPYKQCSPLEAKLLWPEAVDAVALEMTLTSLFLVRDLINTPTEDMGPSELADCAMRVAEEFGVKAKEIIGDDLLKENYPTIHTVGRASDHAPRLVDFTWGNPVHPKITLVGKGVCFDSGGLDLKSANNMALMKKDMGGAAHALGLARMIMGAHLPVRLRVLIPAVENAVSGDAYRPGDIIRTRKGITVEVTNTDAEGRLVLSDALAEAVTEKPDILIDFATLTGAAKVALGADLPALFTANDELAQELLQSGEREKDYIWRLPLFTPYRKMLDSPIADICNSSDLGYGGAITAALFLKEFVPHDTLWAHFDMMAWNIQARPGRPQGGEAVALRGVFAYLQKRFGN